MIIGGFNPVYGDDGGYQNKRTWIYNSSHWIETAATKIARDRPACSLVNLSNGKVLIKSISNSLIVMLYKKVKIASWWFYMKAYVQTF